MLKNWFAAAMQSLEKVPRSLGEVEGSPGSVQVGSTSSETSREGFVASVDRGTSSVAKRGFAEQTLL